MIKFKLFVLLFYLKIVAICASLSNFNSVTVTNVDSSLLMKILQSVDAAPSDKHLFDVTLKLLKSLCVCMRETLRVNENKNAFSGDTNLLEIENESWQADDKVINLYTKIYNNTCFNLRQELASKLNKLQTIVMDVDSNLTSTSNCGKSVKTATDNTYHTSTTAETALSDKTYKLKHIMFKSLVETRKYHNYKINQYNLFKNPIKSRLSSQNIKHSVIVIMTLHLVPNKTNTNPVDETAIVTEEELNKTLYIKSPVDIDIIDTKYGFKNMESEENSKAFTAADCHLESIYKYLTESANNNLTKVFKLIKRNGAIKIYIEVWTMKNHTDYSHICCGKNGNIVCKKDFIKQDLKSNEILQHKENENNEFKNTISKIKSLMRFYQSQIQNKNVSENTVYPYKGNKLFLNTSAKLDNNILIKKKENALKYWDSLLLTKNTLPKTVNKYDHNNYGDVVINQLKYLTSIFDKTLNSSAGSIQKQKGHLFNNLKHQNSSISSNITSSNIGSKQRDKSVAEEPKLENSTDKLHNLTDIINIKLSQSNQTKPEDHEKNNIFLTISKELLKTNNLFDNLPTNLLDKNNGIKNKSITLFADLYPSTQFRDFTTSDMTTATSTKEESKNFRKSLQHLGERTTNTIELKYKNQQRNSRKSFAIDSNKTRSTENFTSENVNNSSMADSFEKTKPASNYKVTRQPQFNKTLPALEQSSYKYEMKIKEITENYTLKSSYEIDKPKTSSSTYEIHKDDPTENKSSNPIVGQQYFNNSSISTRDRSKIGQLKQNHYSNQPFLTDSTKIKEDTLLPKYVISNDNYDKYQNEIQTDFTIINQKPMKRIIVQTEESHNDTSSRTINILNDSTNLTTINENLKNKHNSSHIIGANDSLKKIEERNISRTVETNRYNTNKNIYTTENPRNTLSQTHMETASRTSKTTPLNLDHTNRLEIPSVKVRHKNEFKHGFILPTVRSSNLIDTINNEYDAMANKNTIIVTATNKNEQIMRTVPYATFRTQSYFPTESLNLKTTEIPEKERSNTIEGSYQINYYNSQNDAQITPVTDITWQREREHRLQIMSNEINTKKIQPITKEAHTSNFPKTEDDITSNTIPYLLNTTVIQNNLIRFDKEKTSNDKKSTLRAVIPTESASDTIPNNVPSTISVTVPLTTYYSNSEMELVNDNANNETSPISEHTKITKAHNWFESNVLTPAKFPRQKSILPNITTMNLDVLYSSIVSPTKQKIKRLVSEERIDTEIDNNLLIPASTEQPTSKQKQITTTNKFDEKLGIESTELQDLETIPLTKPFDTTDPTNINSSKQIDILSYETLSTINKLNYVNDPDLDIKSPYIVTDHYIEKSLTKALSRSTAAVPGPSQHNIIEQRYKNGINCNTDRLDTQILKGIKKDAPMITSISTTTENTTKETYDNNITYVIDTITNIALSTVDNHSVHSKTKGFSESHQTTGISGSTSVKLTTTPYAPNMAYNAYNPRTGESLATSNILSKVSNKSQTPSSFTTVSYVSQKPYKLQEEYSTAKTNQTDSLKYSTEDNIQTKGPTDFFEDTTSYNLFSLLDELNSHTMANNKKYINNLKQTENISYTPVILLTSVTTPLPIKTRKKNTESDFQSIDLQRVSTEQNTSIPEFLDEITEPMIKQKTTHGYNSNLNSLLKPFSTTSPSNTITNVIQHTAFGRDINKIHLLRGKAVGTEFLKTINSGNVLILNDSISVIKIPSQYKKIESNVNNITEITRNIYSILNTSSTQKVDNINEHLKTSQRSDNEMNITPNNYAPSIMNGFVKFSSRMHETGSNMTKVSNTTPVLKSNIEKNKVDNYSNLFNKVTAEYTAHKKDEPNIQNASFRYTFVPTKTFGHDVMMPLAMSSAITHTTEAMKFKSNNNEALLHEKVQIKTVGGQNTSLNNISTKLDVNDVNTLLPGNKNINNQVYKNTEIETQVTSPITNKTNIKLNFTNAAYNLTDKPHQTRYNKQNLKPENAEVLGKTHSDRINELNNPAQVNQDLIPNLKNSSNGVATTTTNKILGEKTSQLYGLEDLPENKTYFAVAQAFRKSYLKTDTRNYGQNGKKLIHIENITNDIMDFTPHAITNKSNLHRIATNKLEYKFQTNQNLTSGQEVNLRGDNETIKYVENTTDFDETLIKKEKNPQILFKPMYKTEEQSTNITTVSNGEKIRKIQFKNSLSTPGNIDTTTLKYIGTTSRRKKIDGENIDKMKPTNNYKMLKTDKLMLKNNIKIDPFYDEKSKIFLEDYTVLRSMDIIENTSPAYNTNDAGSKLGSTEVPEMMNKTKMNLNNSIETLLNTKQVYKGDNITMNTSMYPMINSKVHDLSTKKDGIPFDITPIVESTKSFNFTEYLVKSNTHNHKQFKIYPTTNSNTIRINNHRNTNSKTMNTITVGPIRKSSVVTHIMQVGTNYDENKISTNTPGEDIRFQETQKVTNIDTKNTEKYDKGKSKTIYKNMSSSQSIGFDKIKPLVARIKPPYTTKKVIDALNTIDITKKYGPTTNNIYLLKKIEFDALNQFLPTKPEITTLKNEGNDLNNKSVIYNLPKTANSTTMKSSHDNIVTFTNNNITSDENQTEHFSYSNGLNVVPESNVTQRNESVEQSVFDFAVQASGPQEHTSNKIQILNSQTVNMADSGENYTQRYVDYTMAPDIILRSSTTSVPIEFGDDNVKQNLLKDSEKTTSGSSIVYYSTNDSSDVYASSEDLYVINKSFIAKENEDTSSNGSSLLDILELDTKNRNNVTVTNVPVGNANGSSQITDKKYPPNTLTNKMGTLEAAKYSTTLISVDTQESSQTRTSSMESYREINNITEKTTENDYVTIKTSSFTNTPTPYVTSNQLIKTSQGPVRFTKPMIYTDALSEENHINAIHKSQSEGTSNVFNHTVVIKHSRKDITSSLKESTTSTRRAQHFGNTLLTKVEYSNQALTSPMANIMTPYNKNTYNPVIFSTPSTITTFEIRQSQSRNASPFKDYKQVQQLTAAIYSIPTEKSKITTTTVKYNTFQPTVKDDLEITNLQKQINLFKKELKPWNYKNNVKIKSTIKIKNTSTCKLLRNLSQHVDQSLKSFIELVKVSNCSDDNRLTSNQPNKGKSRRIKTLTKNFVILKVNQSNSLLDPFPKTHLYPIKMVSPKSQRKIVRKIQIGGKEKEIMTMNTDDFFAQRRFMTQKGLLNSIMKRRPEMPHVFNPSNIPKEIIIKPRFESIDNPRPIFRPKQILQNDDVFYRHTMKPFSWRVKPQYLQGILERSTYKNIWSTDVVLPRPALRDSPSNKPKFLRDRVASVRKYIKNVDYMKGTTKHAYFLDPLLDFSEEDYDDIDGSKYRLPVVDKALKRSFWIPEVVTQKTTTTKPAKRTRPRRTIFFLSPTVPYNRYF